MAEDKTIIVCSPWSQEQLMVLPSNRTAECASCHARVVVSGDGRRLLAETGGELRCLRCARREAPDTVAVPVPGAIETAARHGVPPKLTSELAGKRLRDVLDEDGRWK